MEPLKRESTESRFIECRTTIAELRTALDKLQASGVAPHVDLFITTPGPFRLGLRFTITRSDYDPIEVAS